jgi:hypothetical protein
MHVRVGHARQWVRWWGYCCRIRRNLSAAELQWNETPFADCIYAVIHACVATTIHACKGRGHVETDPRVLLLVVCRWLCGERVPAWTWLGVWHMCRRTRKSAPFSFR